MALIQKYLDEVYKKYKTGEAVERSYYPLLENLLKEFKNSQIIIEAKNSSVGIPDFKIETEKGLLVGYIEAKDALRDLDKLDQNEIEQIKRYSKEYPKLMVTNFIEFRLYENGSQTDSVIITQPITFKIKNPVLCNEGKFRGLLERFFSTTITEVHTAKRLSELLANKTHILKGLVKEQINLGDDKTTSTEELLFAFRKTLSPQMTEEEFSDMYAQTITFGLFTARLYSKEGVFNRKTAIDFIPHTIPLLRKIFWIISGQEIPQHIEWQVDEIAEILANTKIDKIQTEFFSEGKGRDPIVHFYETFLAQYDPKEREKRGVYYTPLSVVSYITKSIHFLLKEKFGKLDGFADSSVLVLDPAAGTLTFPAQAISLAKNEFVKKYGLGGWQEHVRDHILKDFYAFELLMAPYSVGHLKISLLLKEMGYELKEDDRFKLYLTNTLEMEKIKELEFFGAKEIAEESEKAYEIKHNTPILVIMGNPPYSVSSSNIIKEGSEFKAFYDTYKEKVRKEERNIQPLSDDYIKFIAFAHWKIKQTGKGIIGMITNNSYLDGLIHRDIRRKLIEDFDEIYILNLHGNSKRQEKTPLGGKDENVFDIQQGVGIILLVKDGSNRKKINYSDLWGLREEKYKFLDKNDVSTTKWKKLSPKEPQNFFVSKDFSEEGVYNKFFSLGEIFIKSSSGIKTHRDHFIVDFDETVLSRRILNFINVKNMNDVRLLFGLHDNRDWSLDKSLEKIRKLGYENELLRKYYYSPFDVRWIYYSDLLIDFPRKQVVGSMFNDNLSLNLMRKILNEEWKHVTITDSLSDVNFYGFQTYVFPLYIYNDDKEKQDGLFSAEDKNGKHVNFQQGFLEFVNGIYKDKKVNYEKILHYIYAILYSNLYREKYQEFLKIDFPKIPFTKDYSLFEKVSVLGEELVGLHLLKSKTLNTPIGKFQGQNGNMVEKVEYKNKKVFINQFQYFENIESDVWNYFVGGYQVLLKWLKDRKGRTLSSDEIKHYCKVISSISKTIKLQSQIDFLYPKVEKSLFTTK